MFSACWVGILESLGAGSVEGGATAVVGESTFAKTLGVITAEFGTPDAGSPEMLQPAATMMRMNRRGMNCFLATIPINPMCG